MIGASEVDGFFAEGEPANVAAAPPPTARDPMRGLAHLPRVAVLGRDAIRELARRPIHYVWDSIAVAGTIVLLAGGPGEGKTTLLFVILAARLNVESPVAVLGRTVEPAAPGTWMILIEGEHSESSAARKLLRSLALLGLDEAALDHVILVARKAVRLGSPEWEDVVALIAAGLVSDIAIDTVARVAPSNADSEQEQTAIFDAVAQAIDRAPSEGTKPTCWACAHTRKNNRTGDVSDVSGSVQRVGQADTVMLLDGQKADGRTVATRVTYAKLREEPDDYPSSVTFSIANGEVRVSSQQPADDGQPLEGRIVEQLRSGPKTKNALSTALGRNSRDIECAISALFSSGQITSTQVTNRGCERKAFQLRVEHPTNTRLTPPL